MIVTFISFILSMVGVWCGNIKTWDIGLDFTNAAYASQYRMPFYLTNNIPSTGYMRIVFPYSLHYNVMGQTPQGMSATYQQTTGGHNCNYNTVLQALIFVNLVEPNTYYIQFMDATGLINQTLYHNTIYTMTLVTVGNNLNIQSPGVQAPVQFYSVMAISTTAMIIDQNSIAYVFALSAQPSSSLELAVFTTDLSRQQMTQQYNVSINIQVTKQMLNGGRFLVRFPTSSNNSFIFAGTCYSLIPLSYQYTCQVDSINNQIIISLQTQIYPNDKFFFMLYVRNPLKVIPGTYIEVRSLQLYENTISEIAQSDNLFSVSQLQFQTHKILFGWGLEYSSRSASFYTFPIIVFRGDMNGRYKPYNAFSWKFQLQADLPGDVRLEVEILTPMKFNSFLMPGSISNDLSNYYGQAVQCTFVNQKKLSTSKILCKNVGQLFASQVYQIGCRATFPYDSFNLPLEQHFGTLTIYTVDPVTQVRDTYPATISSNPVQYIQTANNPDWFVSSSPSSFGATLVSTQNALDVTVNDPSQTNLGIFPLASQGDTTMQRMIFSLSIPILDVVKPQVPGNPVLQQPIPFSAGLVMMANHNIQMTSTNPPVLEPLATGTEAFQYQYKTSDLASFVEIKVYASTINGLLGMFCYNTNDIPGILKQFSIKNIQIKFHTSLYADDYLLDFYFATFDQIQGTYPVFQKSLLYNGYTITTPAPQNIRFGVVNYYSGTNVGNTGNFIPTAIRIAGYFSQADLVGASKLISIFFKNMVPFYLNQDSESENQVTCQYSGITQPLCSYYPSGLLANGQSYTNYERVDILFDAIPVGSSDSFQLLIPLSTIANRNDIHIFMAPVTPNTNYATSSGMLQSNAVYRLNGDPNLKTSQFAFTIQSSTIQGGFTSIGIISIQYTLQTTGLTIGTNNTGMTFMIGHSDVSLAVTANSGAQNQANGGGFTLTSTYPFYVSNTLIQMNLANQKDPTGSCITYQYTYQFINSIPSIRYVIFCPFEKGAVSTTTQMVLTGGMVPFVNGDHLPLQTSFSWSDSSKGLRSFRPDPIISIPNRGLLSIVSVSPLLRIGFIQEQLDWTFITSNPIPNGATIEVEFLAPIQFQVINAGSYCVIESSLYGVLNHSCTVSFVLTPLNKIVFTITQCPGCPLPAGRFIVHQWGIDNVATLGTKVSYNVRTRSTIGYIIDQSVVQGTFIYDNTATYLTMYLGNLQLAYKNKRARGYNLQQLYIYRYISLDFYVDRPIWRREKIVMNLGGFSNDNILNQNNLNCFVLESNGSVSTQWQKVDIYGDRPSFPLSSLQLIPYQDINAATTFTLKCNGIQIPYSYNPGPITAQLVLQNSVEVIQISSTVPIDVLLQTNETLLPVKNIALVSKTQNSPGSQVDFMFSIVPTLMNIDSNSVLFVNFPTNYAPYLTKNLTYCQINSQFVACPILNDYTLVLNSFSGSILSGQTVFIRVFGIQQPSLYNKQSSTIFIGITNNTDQTILVQYGFVNDLPPQDIKQNPPINIDILSLQSTNNYIRSQATYTFMVVLPPGSVNVANNLTIDFPEEWDMIINYKLPGCQLYDTNNITNYAFKCSNFGNRVTIQIAQTDYIGNPFYYLTYTMVRNPDYTSCGIDRWVIAVISNTSVVGRSHSAFYNYPAFQFIKNPNQITLQWIDLNTLQEVKLITITTGTFTGRVGLATDYGCFVKSFNVFSVNPLFFTNPINLYAGIGEQLATCLVQGTLLAPQGLSLVEFGKTDDLDRHTALPFLKVFLQSQTFPLTTENSTYEITIGGQALPIYFNLENNAPASNLRIDTATISDKALFLRGPQSVIISANQPKGAFVLAADTHNIAVGDTGQISFIVTCADKQFYSILNFISYRVVVSTRKKPTVLVQQGSNRGATFMQFSVSCSQYATLYYYIAINGSSQMIKTDIVSRVLTFPKSSINDPYNQHFGLVNFFIDNSTQQLQINYLRPSTTYNFSAFCVSTNQLFSSTQVLFFATQSNRGKPFYLDFNFQAAVNRDLSTRMTCFLTTYFKVPARLIRNADNDWCNYERRRRILQTSAEKNNYSQQIVRIYVSALDSNEIDALTPNLQSNIINQTDITTQLFFTVAGLPQLTSISQPVGRSQIPPIFVNQINVAINTSQTQVNITGLQLDVQGFIYTMIDWQNRTTPPTFYDIKQGNSQRIIQYTLNASFNSTTISSYYSRQQYITGELSQFEFDQLTHYTNYSLFYYASTDDPTDFQPRTQVYQIDFQTPPIYMMFSQMILFNLGIGVILITF